MWITVFAITFALGFVVAAIVIEFFGRILHVCGIVE